MNKLDAELMRENLLAAGAEIVDDEATAQAMVFHTCAVREHAEERVLQRARQVKNREAIIAFTGCAAEHLGAEIFAKIPQARLICGTRHFMRIAPLLSRALAGEKIIALGENAELAAASGVIRAHPRSRHRGISGFVSAMRGCNNYCAYCIVPQVRGEEESRPANEILAESLALAARGAAEITLLGQNIDAYGKRQNTAFADLLARLDDALPATVKRLRFVTSHPRDITEKLLRVIAARPRIAKHLHMPAQSGADKILTAMKRGYTRAMYDERLQMIGEIIPDALVASDFIVGFCDETAEDFALTADLVARARFQTAYIFKYSPRAGTYAAEHLRDNVPIAEKRARHQTLLKIQEKNALARHQSLIGAELEILVEGASAREKLKWHGRASNNLNAVFSPERGVAAGELRTVKIERVSPLTLFGSLVD